MHGRKGDGSRQELKAKYRGSVGIKRLFGDLFGGDSKVLPENDAASPRYISETTSFPSTTSFRNKRLKQDGQES
jgi:hypothetical protein